MTSPPTDDETPEEYNARLEKEVAEEAAREEAARKAAEDS